MSQKALFLKEVVDKVGEKIGDEPTARKVEAFAKHGPLFLFFEILQLRKEIERLKTRQTETE